MSLFGRNWLTGLIVLWSGAIVDIPNGWALCDGTNGTPDLRNKFIIGAGDTYNPGASGGSITHSHDGVTSEEYDSFSGTTDEDNDCLMEGSDIDYAYYDPYFDQCTEGHYHAYDGYTDGHVHDLDIDYDGALPPYYALCYIMKL